MTIENQHNDENLDTKLSFSGQQLKLNTKEDGKLFVDFFTLLRFLFHFRENNFSCFEEIMFTLKCGLFEERK